MYQCWESWHQNNWSRDGLINDALKNKCSQIVRLWYTILVRFYFPLEIDSKLQYRCLFSWINHGGAARGEQNYDIFFSVMILKFYLRHNKIKYSIITDH